MSRAAMRRHMFHSNFNFFWIELSSLNEEFSFSFPLSEDRTYSIGNSSENDCVLPECNSRCLLQVKDQRVYFENVSESSTAVVKIGDQQVKKCIKHLLRVEPLSRPQSSEIITFGPYYFFAKATHEPNSNFQSALRNLAKCFVCGSFWFDPACLPCGHVICHSCLQAMANDAIEIVNRRIDQQLQNSLLITFEEPTAKCFLCLTRFTLKDMFQTSGSLPKVVKDISDVTRLWLVESSAIRCSQCSDTRCVTNMCDYYFCECCHRIVCPLCCLDNHTDHLIASLQELSTKRSYEYRKWTFMMKRRWTKMRQEIKESLLCCDKTVEYPVMFFRIELNRRVRDLDVFSLEANKRHTQLIESSTSNEMIMIAFERFEESLRNLSNTLENEKGEIIKIGQFTHKVKPMFPKLNNPHGPNNDDEYNSVSE